MIVSTSGPYAWGIRGLKKGNSLATINGRSKVNKEYNELIDYAYDLGVRNCFTQEEESQSDSFIPNFKGDTINKNDFSWLFNQIMILF